jgi:16S rRNA (uracil1498-N3)-methyltransferase
VRDYRHFLFFAEHIESDRLYLGAGETRHAVAVLRRAKGDPFIATDGQGTVYECRVESITRQRCTGLIIGRTVVPRHQCSLHLLVGLPDRAAFETLIGDLTALGVSRITPLVCRYCQPGWWERNAGAGKLSERFRSKMIAALKQSLYPYLPRLDPPLLFEAISSAFSGSCLVADPTGLQHFSEALESLRNQSPSCTCLVGPPGGLAPEETAVLKTLSAVFVNLAPTRLTTELAAAVLAGGIIGARCTEAPFSVFPGTAA